ncbi:MAG: glutathione S-transferase family protein [Rhodospirillales bacterium]|jgi:glutathione S-transferase|nr:glutathione S-transferase family protein [Rhodospirillales bacterium]
MVILHHYPQSPVSEKVRVVLGLKGLDWRSVEIPRLPPKPDLMPLTGGYRLTPVMQVGADVYCDSQCIIRELERRFPEPTLFPEGAPGMAWGLGRWTDGPMFRTAVALVFGAGAADLPAEFAADRGLLYFGPEFDLSALTRTLPETLAQLRAQFGWLEDCFADGRDFLTGARPGLADALGYYLVWFVRGRYAQGPEFLESFERLCAWESRVKDIGHGNMRAIDAGEALDAARDGEPAAPRQADPDDPQGLTPGDQVEVVPDGVDGAPPVSGRVHALAPQEIVIHRSDGRVGDVAVHFPRVGYRVRRV